MDQLMQAITAFAVRHADETGLAPAPVPGVRMKVLSMPSDRFHAVYRPMVCLILQGAKQLVIGTEERTACAGQTVIVSADVPVAARVVDASAATPYIAIAIDLDVALLRDLATKLPSVAPAPRPRPLFAVDTEAAALDCAARLMQLIDRPDAIPLLRPGIMRELHYWLLSGPHAPSLRDLADPDGNARRLAPAIALLQAEYRAKISVERLAAAAAMSPSNFHKHFKQVTSLTPGQYQKQLRLIEARRLLLDSGLSASSASFEVGYESVSQFTREYRRMFQAPPKRDALRRRSAASDSDTGKSGSAAAIGNQ